MWKIDISVGDETRELDADVYHDKPFTLVFGKVNVPTWQPWSLGEQERLPVKIEMQWEGRLSDEYRGMVDKQASQMVNDRFFKP